MIRRLALAAINAAAAAAEWLLDTHLDARVCRLSNDLSGSDDD